MTHKRVAEARIAWRSPFSPGIEVNREYCLDIAMSH